MKVKVKLFAAAGDLAGKDNIAVELGGVKPFVKNLRKALAKQCPALRNTLRKSRFAVGAEFAGESRALNAGDEIALIPPVGGG